MDLADDLATRQGGLNTVFVSLDLHTANQHEISAASSSSSVFSTEQAIPFSRLSGLPNTSSDSPQTQDSDYATVSQTRTFQNQPFASSTTTSTQPTRSQSPQLNFRTRHLSMNSYEDGDDIQFAMDSVAGSSSLSRTTSQSGYYTTSVSSREYLDVDETLVGLDYPLFATSTAPRFVRGRPLSSSFVNTNFLDTDADSCAWNRKEFSRLKSLDDVGLEGVRGIDHDDGKDSESVFYGKLVVLGYQASIIQIDRDPEKLKTFREGGNQIFELRKKAKPNGIKITQPHSISTIQYHVEYNPWNWPVYEWIRQSTRRRSQSRHSGSMSPQTDSQGRQRSAPIDIKGGFSRSLSMSPVRSSSGEVFVSDDITVGSSLQRQISNESSRHDNRSSVVGSPISFVEKKSLVKGIPASLNRRFSRIPSMTSSPTEPSLLEFEPRILSLPESSKAEKATSLKRISTWTSSQENLKSHHSRANSRNSVDFLNDEDDPITKRSIIIKRHISLLNNNNVKRFAIFPVIDDLSTDLFQIGRTPNSDTEVRPSPNIRKRQSSIGSIQSLLSNVSFENFPEIHSNQVDFVVPGESHVIEKHSGKYAVHNPTASKLAFRICCNRNDPSDIRLFAGSFDNLERIQFDDKTLRWSEDCECCSDIDSVDAFAESSVLLWRPDTAKWVEISAVRGHAYNLRPDKNTRGSRSPSIINYTCQDNRLTDGCVIYNGGVAFLFRTTDTEAQTKAFDEMIGGFENKMMCPITLETIPVDAVADSIRGRSFRSLEELRETLAWVGDAISRADREASENVFSKKSPDRQKRWKDIRMSKKDNLIAGRPWLFLNCGHVFSNYIRGTAPWLLQNFQNMCAICRTSGPFVPLIFRTAPDILCESPTHFFSPCGHAIHEEGAKFWSENFAFPPKLNPSIVDHEPVIGPEDKFEHQCPFCRTKILAVGKLFWATGSDVESWSENDI
ncbi:E3 ubiquitin-protein ligase pellino 2 [Nowakowskiella sp. JEL0078]|nr:E3 ubiquitin-protein ligase pellino 2 [Nowakowskiella sp. JEL0078]